MEQGVIIKVLSGFYTISSERGPVECRARGHFRKEGISPLVGDNALFTRTGDERGVVEALMPRRSVFVRPAVANMDLLVVIASAKSPATDPYLIDRVAAIAMSAGCGVLICINKVDLDRGDGLYWIYESSGLGVLRTSAVTGEGMESLRAAIGGRTCVFTGNSGVGKSSILNAVAPRLQLPVGEISRKLGRGRHTTRHVELFDLGGGTYIADTPGFSSFDMEQMEPVRKERLQDVFPEFAPFLGSCRFQDCAHLCEPGCAVLEAVSEGKIHPSRHASYARLYELAAMRKDWEMK
jgi:ribosome biogenesis GTPase